MNPPNAIRILLRAAIGGTVGFFVGLASGIPYGTLCCIGPLVGGIMGAGLAAVAHPWVSCAFFAGMLATGPFVFAHYNAVAHAQIGEVWRADIAPSEGYLLAPMILASGGGILGGAIAGAVMAAIRIRKEAAKSVATFLVLAVTASLGLALFGTGKEVFESWVSFEGGYQRSMRGPVRAEKMRLAPGPRDLPPQPGPFLYPNRTGMGGDSYVVTIRTADSVAKVQAYYEKIGATFTSSDGGLLGTFPYQGRTMKVRIAYDPPTSETKIQLSVAGY